MTADFRALCAELAEFVARLTKHYYEPAELLTRARAALADEPAVPEGREPVAVTGQPSVEELALVYHDCCGGCEFMDQGGFEDAAGVVLARWGNHQGSLDSSPPADGEVAELVVWLLDEAIQAADASQPTAAGMLTWAAQVVGEHAELLQRQALVPVSVSERLPEANTKVLAHYLNDLGNGRTICAIWVPAKSRSDEGGCEDFTEYDEEDDKFYWPEGWYEAIENWDELGWVQVYEGEVAYWQPLPKWPAHALPIPHQQETNND